MNLIEKATNYAREAHAGQKRKFSGEDYVNHPIRVASKTREFVSAHFYDGYDVSYKILTIVQEAFTDSKLNQIDFEKLINILSLVHDSEEDAYEKGFTIDYLINYLGQSLKEIKNENTFLLKLRIALKKLTHSKNTPYKDYILDIKTYPIARLVKIADIMDNMSDLKPGAQKDKYDLALHILLN